MKIKRIEIKNFRQYQDVDLLFSSAKKYDLNYILAENGVGKTTLLNSITWCLYGEELHITRGLEDKTLPLLTLKTLRELEPTEEIETSVKITIEELDGTVQFERIVTFRKTEEGQAFPKTKNVKVLINPKNGEPELYKDEENFTIEVNKRLPRKINQFFFFDGEQLDTYLASKAGENVEQTVLEVSQIDLLVTMSKNLKTISDEIRKEATNKDSSLKKLNQQYTDAEKDALKAHDDYVKLREAVKQAKLDLDNINKDLGDDPDIEELEKKREELDSEYNDEKRHLSDANSKLKEFLTKYYMLLSLLPNIKILYNIIKEKEKNNELPPQYDKQLLENMLKNCRCDVCQRVLDTDSIIAISDLLKRFNIGQETGILLSKMSVYLENLILESKKYEELRDMYWGARVSIEGKIDNIKTEISEIDNIIDKFTDKEAIIKKQRKRVELEQYIEDNEQEVIRKQIEDETASDKKKEIKRLLDAALNKADKNKKLIAQSRFAEKAYKKVDVIIDSIKDKIRQNISREMHDKFFELMWKRKFKNVEITNNYSATVVNDDGFECLGSCSAAERELLVLAFTLALHKESGFDGPLVIDTPISRISGDLRVAFAKVLRKVSEEKQIILFVTEDEYSVNVKDVFELHANKKYGFKLVNEDYVEVSNL